MLNRGRQPLANSTGTTVRSTATFDARAMQDALHSR